MKFISDLNFHFLRLSDIMELRHQSSAMCIITLEGARHTRGLQRKEETHSCHNPSGPAPTQEKTTNNNSYHTKSQSTDRNKTTGKQQNPR